MKKFAALLISILFMGTLTACANQSEEAVRKEPEITQIRSICNLATLECYYHNVAKSVKTAGQGIGHIGEVDREYWIEYTGVAKIGIDMSRVAMEMDGNNITITLPPAELISVNVEESTLNDDAYISSADGLNKNKITAEDQTNAIYDAQKEMEESVKNNASLLLSAQTRAQELIENYIYQLGEISGAEYEIHWIYEEK
uniref:DUF4230 domain-containing protein n=1 Tax=Agathobacter sp. TaxID=2021311 RepID=UPI004055FE68